MLIFRMKSKPSRASACNLLHARIFLGLLLVLNMMEVLFSSEISVDFHQTTRRYIPESKTPHNHRCHRHENLRTHAARENVLEGHVTFHCCNTELKNQN
jgi:hypothetical protein